MKRIGKAERDLGGLGLKRDFSSQQQTSLNLKARIRDGKVLLFCF